jgi:hypothetical protein
MNFANRRAVKILVVCISPDSRSWRNKIVITRHLRKCQQILHIFPWIHRQGLRWTNIERLNLEGLDIKRLNVEYDPTSNGTNVEFDPTSKTTQRWKRPKRLSDHRRGQPRKIVNFFLYHKRSAGPTCPLPPPIYVWPPRQIWIIVYF